MDHDWVAIGMAAASIVISIASIVLSVLAERRAEENRRSS